MRRVMRLAPAMRPPPVTRSTRPVPNARSEPEPVDGVVVAPATCDVGVLLELELELVDAGAVPDPDPVVTVFVVVAVGVLTTVVPAVTVVGAVTVVVPVWLLVVTVVTVTVDGDVVVTVTVVPGAVVVLVAVVLTVVVTVLVAVVGDVTVVAVDTVLVVVAVVPGVELVELLVVVAGVELVVEVVDDVVLCDDVVLTTVVDVVVVVLLQSGIDALLVFRLFRSKLPVCPVISTRFELVTPGMSAGIPVIVKLVLVPVSVIVTCAVVATHAPPIWCWNTVSVSVSPAWKSVTVTWPERLPLVGTHVGTTIAVTVVGTVIGGGLTMLLDVAAKSADDATGAARVPKPISANPAVPSAIPATRVATILLMRRTTK